MRRAGRCKKKEITAIDYDEVEAFLVGHCGKTIKEAMMVSAEEYGYLLRGYSEKIQSNYEIARWVSFNTMLTSPFIKNRPHSLHQFAPFPWDAPEIIHPSRVTAEENAELNKMLDEIIAKRKRHE